MASVEAEDWRVGLSLLQRQRYMLEGQYGADVKFVVGDSKQTIMAHRFVLVCASAVFEAILTSAKLGVQDVVLLRGVEPTAFKEMLRYIYYEEVVITTENVISLLHVAITYRISDLVEQCSAFVSRVLSVDSVSLLLEDSIKFSVDSVTKTCMTFIDDNIKDILKSDQFTQISNRSLLMITASETLTGIEESEIVQACLQWADALCLREGNEVSDLNRRAALGDVLFQIRFPIMTAAEFTRATRNSRLLTSSERAGVFDHIAAHGSGSEECDCSMKFKTTARGASTTTAKITNKGVVIKRLLGTFYNGKPPGQEAIDLVCSRPVVLRAVGIYGGYTGHIHKVRVQLIDPNDQVVSDTGKVEVTSSGSYRPVRVPLPGGAPLDAGTRYSVVVNILGAGTYSGRHGVANVTTHDLTVTFHNSSHPSKQTSVSQGQIPVLYFKL